jgi:DNA-binding transcriptional LysR family regulator
MGPSLGAGLRSGRLASTFTRSCDATARAAAEGGDMDLRRIKYFVVVAEELHFRRAAARLYITQPVVSEQIRKLEGELGVQLLVRTPQRVSLTEAGAAFLPDARRLLAYADDLERTARRASAMAGAAVRIAFGPDAVPSALAPALGRLRETSPGVAVRVAADAGARLLEELRDDRADAVVVTLPAPVGGLRVVELATDDAVVAIPPGRPLPTRLTLAALAETPLLTFARPTNPGFFALVSAAFTSAGLHAPLVESGARGVEALALEIAATGRPAIVPASCAGRLDALGVDVAGLDDGPAATTALVTRDEEPSAALAALVAELTAVPRLHRAARLAAVS